MIKEQTTLALTNKMYILYIKYIFYGWNQYENCTSATILEFFLEVPNFQIKIVYKDLSANIKGNVIFSNQNANIYSFRA